MARKRPTVAVMAWTVPEVAWLEPPGQVGVRIRLDTPEWTTWLDGPGVSFAYPVYDASCGYIAGFMTVRKEQRRRGGSYWTVYRRCGARVRKVYVGPSRAVTNVRLAEIAQRFLHTERSCHGTEAPTVSSY